MPPSTARANLSRTKTFAPRPGASQMARPELVATLERGARGRVILVSAPAGFGKSTAVAQWLAVTGRRSAWLSLEGGDRDPLVLICAVIEAIASVFAGFGSELVDWTQAPERPSFAALRAEFLAELSQLEGGWCLVLDDVHALKVPHSDELLGALIDRLPAEVVLVLLTRHQPDLPLARLRASGDLLELRAPDLRFSRQEMERYFNQVRSLDLSADQLSALELKTEGWPSGLQLAALSLEKAPDREGFVRAFSGTHRDVLDYLLEEVWQKLSPQTVAFLVATSVLDRLCGPLCDALLELEPGQGQRSLEYLEAANLFLIPLDDERRWYRYHHLFADLLRQRRTQNPEPLLRRACLWFEDEGLSAEAFAYAVRTGDVDLTTRLVEGKGMPLIFQGCVVPVVDWLGSLDPRELDRRPVLWVLYASALLFVNDLAGIPSKLDRAERALGEPTPASGDLHGHIASIRATLAVLYRDARSVALQSERALSYLDRANIVVRTATLWTSGVACQLAGDLVGARRAFEEALDNSRAIGHYIITVLSTLGLAQMAEMEGRQDEAETLFRSVVTLSGKMTVACEAWLGLARLALGRHQTAQARHCAQKAVDLARRIPGTDPLVHGLLLLARTDKLEGQRESAGVLLREALEIISTYGLEHCRTAYDQVAGPTADPGLSARELEVLTLIAEGLSNEQIAARLFLAESSVKGHNQRIFEKLGVKRRTEGVAKARELGLLG